MIVRGRRSVSCEISRSEEKTKNRSERSYICGCGGGGLNPACLCMGQPFCTQSTTKTPTRKKWIQLHRQALVSVVCSFLSFAFLSGGALAWFVLTICTSQLCFPPLPSRQVFGFHFIPCTRPAQLICVSIDCPSATPRVGSHGFDFTRQSHVQAGRREGRSRRPRAAAWDGCRTSLALAGVVRTPRPMPMSLSMHIGLVVVVL